MAPPSQGSREQKLSDGLRKLQEFQRRKEQSSAAAESVRGGPIPCQSSRAPHDAPLQRLTPQRHCPSPQMAAAATGTSPQLGPSTAVTVPSPTNGDLGARIQSLIEQLSVVAASGASRDLQQLEVVQRYCAQLAREANEAQLERQNLTRDFESLRATHLQATRTIELLVEEKSRLLISLDSLEKQLQARTHETVVRDAEIRALRERVAINDGQIAHLLQEKEHWNQSRDGSTKPTIIQEASSGVSSNRLKEQVADLEEQLRLSTEKICHLQRAEERSREAYEAARNELKVAQAYVQQLAGASIEDGAVARHFGAGTSLNEQALQSQLERLREELDLEKHERSAAELIARNLEASNKGLQQRVVELERNMPTPSSLQLQQSSELKSIGHIGVDRRDIHSQTEAETSSDAIAEEGGSISEPRQQNEYLQTQLSQLEEQLCSERDRWSEEMNSLRIRMAANADELQRAKLDVSRAVAQNKQLKNQIEELQDVFIKLSNDKLDLTEEVHREKHRAQQLEAQVRNLQLQQQRNEARSSSTAKDGSDPGSVDADQAEQYALQIQQLEAQIADWAARYADLERQHAQGVAQHKIDTRIHQQQIKHVQTLPRHGDDEGSRGTPHTSGDSPGGSLSLSEYEFVDTPPHGAHQTSNTQRQTLINNDAVNNNNDTNNANTASCSNYVSQRMDRMEETGSIGPERNEPIGDLTESIGDALSVLDNVSSTSSRSEQAHLETEHLTNAAESAAGMQHERRLAEATMKIARLEEDKSQLEHQVEQLRMETDTISDYIQLYQQQRAALSQRQKERDAYIKQILEDREALSSKVNQLQTLIAKILPVSPQQTRSELTEAVNEGESDREEVRGSPTPNEVIAHKILQALEDLTEVSTTPPAGLDTFYRCSSCQGCQGRLLSL